MGERELQEALRARAHKRIDAAWQAAEAAVAARRAAIEDQRQALCATMQRQLAGTAAAERRRLLAETERALRRQRLTALQALEGRLQALAGPLLAGLGDSRRHRTWAALAGELPAAEWQRVRVHPEDLDRARRAFPGAEVAVDATLAGGLVAETGDGRIVLDNSLAGRLAQAWPALLTPLAAAVCEEVDKDAAGPAATG